MRFQYFVVPWLVVTCLLPSAFAQGDYNKDNKQRCITDCDREIGTILCDDHISEMCGCADLMPPEEHPYFYECAKNKSLVDTNQWEPLLKAVCEKKKTAVEEAYDITECWDKKMREAVDEMGDDNVYPQEHFECKRKIYKAAIKKASCPCQMEKGSVCDSMNPSKSFG